MLVSHAHRFIYTKTSKTGGTSVEAYFERFCMPDWTPSHARDEHVSDVGIVGWRGNVKPDDCQWWNHMPALAIKEKLGFWKWWRYFKFCVVRNPFEKAISAFYFDRRNPDGSVRRGTPEQERADFEAWINDGVRLVTDRAAYMINGRVCVDDFMRHENLHQDLERICTRLSLPWNPDWLPTFKSGIRPANTPPAKLHTERTIEVVSDAFRFELDNFGYSPPPL